MNSMDKTEAHNSILSDLVQLSSTPQKHPVINPRTLIISCGQRNSANTMIKSQKIVRSSWILRRGPECNHCVLIRQWQRKI